MAPTFAIQNLKDDFPIVIVSWLLRPKAGYLAGKF